MKPRGGSRSGPPRRPFGRPPARPGARPPFRPGDRPAPRKEEGTAERRSERPHGFDAPRPQRDGKPAFRREDRGPRPDRPPYQREDRPRFPREDRPFRGPGDRPQRPPFRPDDRGGFAPPHGDRPARRYGDRPERPPFRREGRDEGPRPDRPPFRRDDRPPFARGEKRPFQRDERPSYPRDDRPPRRFDGAPPRPRGDRPPFRPGERAGSSRPDRPPFRREGRDEGPRPDRPPFPREGRDRGPRPDRPPFRGRDDRPSFAREERRPLRPDGGFAPPRGDRPPRRYGDRPDRPPFRRDERPDRPRPDRPPFRPTGPDARPRPSRPPFRPAAGDARPPVAPDRRPPREEGRPPAPRSRPPVAAPPHVVADAMPASVRRELKPRPERALPAGAFPVPLSTLDWLLSRESPAARYVALRDLLHRPAKDIERRKARQVLVRDTFLRDSLPHLRAMLPTGAASDVSEAVDPGTSFVLLLLEVGCDADVPELKHAADLLLARWQRVFVDVERGETPAVGSGFVAACRALALLGFAGDPRLLAGAELLARRRVSSEDAAESVAGDLLVLTSVAEESRSPVVRNAISFCVERAKSRELPASAAEPARTGVGVGDAPDLLELLQALAAAGAPRSAEVDAALSRLAARADHRARWKLERPIALRLPVPLEREGELSRWVTLRALGVMQHFLGLTITGAP